MYNITKIDPGIHTGELSISRLKYSQVQKVNDTLAKTRALIPCHSDTDNIQNSYLSHAYEDLGVTTIRTFQSPMNSNGISFAVNPETMLTGEYQPVKLFKPSEESCRKIIKTLLKIAKKIHLEDLDDSKITADRLSLSQVDVTINLWFDDGTDLYPIIRLFEKSKLPSGFEIYDNEHDYFCCGTKSGTLIVKVYDKIRELSERGHLPKSLKGEIMLRIEISMKREKFIKEFGLSRDASLFEMLTVIYEQGQTVIAKYLEKLFPVASDHYTYKATISAIEKKAKKKLRPHMCYLVDKISKKEGRLDKAITSLMKSEGLKDNQIKRLLEEFNKIGVNPVALPIKFPVPSVPSIRHMIAECKTISAPKLDLDEERMNISY